jgi:hypothetical protein
VCGSSNNFHVTVTVSDKRADVDVICVNTYVTLYVGCLGVGEAAREQFTANKGQE